MARRQRRPAVLTKTAVPGPCNPILQRHHPLSSLDCRVGARKTAAAVMPASIPVFGAALGVGIQLYVNAVRKLPLMRDPWLHVLWAGAGASFGTWLVSFEERTEKELTGESRDGMTRCRRRAPLARRLGGGGSGGGRLCRRLRRSPRSPHNSQRSLLHDSLAAEMLKKRDEANKNLQ